MTRCFGDAVTVDQAQLPTREVRATGAAILDLAPGNPKSPARGEGQLSDAQIEYLLTGWSYALVTSRKYPQGEARGQLDRVRTATPAFQ